MPTPYRIADPVQQRVHNRLSRLVGPGPAAHFRDSCRVMEALDAFESATTLVGHLLRELEDALREVLVPRDGTATDEAPALDPDLERILTSEGMAADSSLARAVTGLLRSRSRRSSRGSHASQIRAILGALGIPADSEVAATWLRLAKREYGLPRLAHRRNLDAPRPPDSEFVAFWESMVRVFDDVLAQFEMRFHAILEEVTALRRLSHPTADDVRRLTRELPNAPIVRRHFFDESLVPAWLPLLAQEGWFHDPPAPVVDRDRRSVAYPDWPASRYIAQVAGEPSVQAEVARVLDALPATENSRVVADVIRALTALPSTLAVVARERVLAWLERQDELLLLDSGDVLPLARHLANEGDVAGAMRVLRLLVEIRPRRGPAGAGAPRVGFWDYRRLLAETLPAEAFFPDPYDLFCFLLERLEECPDAETAPDGLASHFQRHAIEDSSQDNGDDPFGILVSAVRDAAAEIVTRDPFRLDRVVSRLRTGETAVVWKTRLELNVLRSSPQPAPAHIEARLLDRGLLAGADCYHEYRTLLRDRFSVLPAATQARLLALLVEAPSVDRIQSERAANGDPPLPEAEAAELRELVTRDLLSLVSDALSEPFKTSHRSLVERHGSPRHPEFLSYVTSSVGFQDSRSPISSEELAALDVSDLRAFLETWVPPANRFDEPTREGLASALTAAVGTRPDHYAPSLDALRVGEPTYVRGVISGYHVAVVAKRPIPWGPALAYCLWAVQPRPLAPPPPPAPLGRDPSWNWVHGAVLELVRAGLDRDARVIPFECRDAVWSVLSALARDPSSPTPEQDATVRDFASSGTNCTRGRALELAIEYGIWVREASGPDAPASFDLLPEVRTLLEALLDPAREPSPSVRAVVGTELGRLAHLDAAWLAARLDAIFPAHSDGQELRRAAWSAYIRYGYVNAFMYRLLRPIFDEEVAAFLADPDQDSAEGRQLAQHLAWLYVWGAVPLAPDGPFAAFLDRGPSTLVRLAIGSVGRALLHGAEPVPGPVRDRLEALWTARLASLSSDRGRSTEELEEFAWWFASRKLDPSWAADRLLEGAELRGGLPANNSLLEALTELAPSMPDRAVRIVREVVRGEEDPGLLTYQAPAFRAVIVAARAASGGAAEPAIQATLGMLASKGCTGFLDLSAPRPGAAP